MTFQLQLLSDSINLAWVSHLVGSKASSCKAVRIIYIELVFCSSLNFTISANPVNQFVLMMEVSIWYLLGFEWLLAPFGSPS